jgi:hypothetical protein
MSHPPVSLHSTRSETSVLHTTPPQTPVSLHPTLSPVSSLLSTPSKKNSSQPPGSSGVLQKDLKEILGEELSNQVWEFSAERVADMLHPSKYPKRADAIEAAARHLSDILKTNPPIFPGSEGGSYEPLAFVLNACMEACASVARDRIIPTDLMPWFAGLRFYASKIRTADGVDGAAHLKPNLVGVIYSGARK